MAVLDEETKMKVFQQFMDGHPIADIANDLWPHDHYLWASWKAEVEDALRQSIAELIRKDEEPKENPN